MSGWCQIGLAAQGPGITPPIVRNFLTMRAVGPSVLSRGVSGETDIPYHQSHPGVPGPRAGDRHPGAAGRPQWGCHLRRWSRCRDNGANPGLAVWRPASRPRQACREGDHTVTATFPFLIDNGRCDFAYPSHTLEHSPNPIAALYNQMRVVRATGTANFTILNRRMMYDVRRSARSNEKPLRLCRENDFSGESANVSELLWGLLATYTIMRRRRNESLRSRRSRAAQARSAVVLIRPRRSYPSASPQRFPD